MASKRSKDTQPEDIPADDSKGLTADRILRLWDEGRSETATARINYWLNYAFWRGAQWVWSKNGYTADTEIVPVATTAKARREQATQNRIKPAVHTIISSAMKVPISLEILATSADDHSHEGAQLGESLLRQKSIDDDWEHLRERWLTACYLGGTAALITEWNPQGRSDLTGADTGDGTLDVMSIEDFVLEPGSPEAKTARYFIRKQVLPAEAVQAMYGLKEKPKEDATEGGPFGAKTIQYFSVLTKRRGTQVLTYYERPNPLRPNGAVAVVVGNQIVWGKKVKDATDKKDAVYEPQDWTYLYPFTDHLNIEVGVCILDPESWMGESPVTDAISPQRQYNALWTKIHEITHRTVGSKMIMDKRHAEMNKNLTDDPSDVVYLSAADGAAEPHYMVPPQLPAQTVQQLQELKEQIDDTLYNHPISRGIAGSNAPDSGYGLSILAENDSTPTGRLLKECARVFAGSSSNLLKLYEAKVKAKRKTVVTERRGMGRPMKWNGKSLAGQTRAIVPPDSVLPRSHAGMLELGKQMMQMRPDWFKTPGQFLAFILAPGVDNMVDILDDDVSLAEDENYYMADGVSVEVNDFDDHAKHVQQHNHFRKSKKYRSLSEEQKQLFQLHIDNHKAMQAHETGKRRMLSMMDPALGADPLLGGGISPLNTDPIATSSEPSGAEAITPQVPPGV